MNEAMSIRFEALPLDEEVKGRQGKGEPGWERGPGTIRHFLEMTDAAQL